MFAASSRAAAVVDWSLTGSPVRGVYGPECWDIPRLPPVSVFGKRSLPSPIAHNHLTKTSATNDGAVPSARRHEPSSRARVCAGILPRPRLPGPATAPPFGPMLLISPNGGAVTVVAPTAGRLTGLRWGQAR